MKKSLIEDQNNLKINGEKIILDFDNCEIKENNYFNDVIPGGYSYRTIEKSITPEFVENSIIIYHLKK